MTASHQLSLVAYKSRISCTDDDISRIVETSRRNNSASDITGALIYDTRTFFQMLEGPTGAVGEALLRICGDARHRQVEIVVSDRVDFRLFSNWSLKQLPIEDRRVTLESLLRDLAIDDPRERNEGFCRFALSL